MTALGKLHIVRKTGQEKFLSSRRSLGFDLKSFWQWATSDLISNTTRGVLAEYLVARAIDIGKDDTRDEWAASDLQTPTGIKIQVKSAAYVQSWHQKKLSNIVFNVQPRRAWDSNTNVLARDPARHSDIYVFAVLAHRNKATINPLNTQQWEFYVLPTITITARKRSQHSITLKSLEKLCTPVNYANLGGVIEATGKATLSTQPVPPTSRADGRLLR
jgi:hypothetical protein